MFDIGNDFVHPTLNGQYYFVDNAVIGRQQNNIIHTVILDKAMRADPSSYILLSGVKSVGIYNVRFLDFSINSFRVVYDVSNYSKGVVECQLNWQLIEKR